MRKVCVFAGTAEGRRLVERICGRGVEVVACAATEYGGELLAGQADVRVHVGRMDEAEMAAFFAREGFALVVDATHPYADRATENIRRACEQGKIEYLRLSRGSDAALGDGVFVPDVAACVAFLRETEGPVLLTTGSKELPAFCADEALRGRIYARVLPVHSSLEVCVSCGLTPERIFAMQGPFDEEMNMAMLRAAHAQLLVTKDTGDAGGYAAKIRAAERTGVQAVIIGRPPQVDGISLEEAVRTLEARFSLADAPKRVLLIGMGMGDADSRTLAAERALREADCLIGSRRMLEAVDGAGKIVREAIAAEDIVRIIREESARRFAVLLSGDPGFYSGAKRLLGALKGTTVEVLPGIGSLQYFCAKLRIPWENVYCLSLHGRDGDIAGAVRTHEATFALLGGNGGARRALECLCAAGMGRLRASIGECLAAANERIVRGSVQELASMEYDALSVLLVENPHAGACVVTHGLPDDAFERDDVPMTKSEVRSVALSKLQLTQAATVYDVGSGSGSMTVEAALLAKRGRVYAVEMRESALALTRRNVEKFALRNVEVVEGEAPEALAELPKPTHAFIGGSEGRMRAIIDALLEKNPAVRIVATAVTLESVAELTQIVKQFTFSDIVEVSIAKPRTLGRYRLMTAQNPVYIFTMHNGGEQP